MSSFFIFFKRRPILFVEWGSLRPPDSGLQNVLVSYVCRIVTLEVVVHRMGLGFNLFLGDQMAVLASDVVCVRLRLLRCPTPGARSVLWHGDCSECARGMMTLYVCVVGDGYRPCTDGSRGPPF